MGLTRSRSQKRINKNALLQRLRDMSSRARNLRLHRLSVPLCLRASVLKASIVAAISWVLMSQSSGFAAEPVEVDVFKSGSEGYHTFRIPALVVTKNGTVLA